MNDLISRQAAIDAVHEEFDECLVWDESGQRTADEFEIIINRLPSAEPVRHGKWIDTFENNIKYGTCSLCGDMSECVDTMNYCSNCGARMDAE